MPDWGKVEFYAFPAQSWEDILPAVSSNGRDLTRRLLRYQSSERHSADEVSDCENNLTHRRTLMMAGTPTSVFLHRLISRPRWLPHHCGCQPHGTGPTGSGGVCGPYLGNQEPCHLGTSVAVSTPSSPRMQRWGEVQYIFQGYDGDMEPLYRVHEAQGIMDNMYSVLCTIIVHMYCGKRSGLSGSQLGKRRTHTTNNNQAHLRIAVKQSIIVIETLSLESDQIKMQSQTRRHEPPFARTRKMSGWPGNCDSTQLGNESRGAERRETARQKRSLCPALAGFLATSQPCLGATQAGASLGDVIMVVLLLHFRRSGERLSEGGGGKRKNRNKRWVSIGKMESLKSQETLCSRFLFCLDFDFLVAATRPHLDHHTRIWRHAAVCT